MKKNIFTLFIVVSIMLTILVGSASAQAYVTNFTTSITYVNVGTAATTTLDLLFYASPDDTTPTSYSLPSLAANAAGSLYVGSLDPSIVPTGFEGDAIMQSDQPMLVTLVQVPVGSPTVKNRPLSNGFGAGGPQSLIATVLKNVPSHYISVFSIQNADAEANNVAITFYDLAANPVHTINQTIASGAAFYVDASTVAGLGTTFNGSAIAVATRSGGGAGSIVSSVMEMQDNGVGVEAFEGVASGSSLYFMASALCQFKGSTTYYAVQNASLTTPTSVTVTYFTTAGGTYSVTKNIGAGAKASFDGCETGAMPAGSLGAAKVESTATPVIAIGKASGNGLTTAFNGVSVGYADLGLPYVRWADDVHWSAGTHQRTFITIQNVGSTTIPEGTHIFIDYNDPTGATVGTHDYVVAAGGLASGAKFNSSAQDAGLSNFGYWNNYTTAGGAAIVSGPAGLELTAVARVSTQTSPNFYTSEDYNSQPLP